ncbi:unnamed protein product, partial [Oppiella nova]
ISCFDSSWSKRAIDYFKKYVSKRHTFTGKIYSSVNRVVRLELFKNDDMKVSFNDELVNIGYAEKWEENSQSKLNHSHRRRDAATRDDSLGHIRFESFAPGVYNPDDAVQLSPEFYPNFGANIRTHERIQLRGPFNPLECTFKGVSRQTSF